MERVEMAGVDVILFDLGGVLVEFTGVEKIIAMSAIELSAEELWRRWLTSTVVRAFETGQSTPYDFAVGLIEEFSLPIDPDELSEEFRSWLSHRYDGVDELLDRLRGRYRLACFSNTNDLHWPRMRDEFAMGGLFDATFLSYEIGMLKPDREAFEYVAASLGVSPERILFLDDNNINVEAARAVGFQAARVEGVVSAEQELHRRGLL